MTNKFDTYQKLKKLRLEYKKNPTPELQEEILEAEKNLKSIFSNYKIFTRLNILADKSSEEKNEEIIQRIFKLIKEKEAKKQSKIFNEKSYNEYYREPRKSSNKYRIINEDTGKPLFSLVFSTDGEARRYAEKNCFSDNWMISKL